MCAAKWQWWWWQFSTSQYTTFFCYKTQTLLIVMTIFVNLASQNLASHQNYELYSSAGNGGVGGGKALKRVAADCVFPTEWHGSWFHFGFPKPLNISKDFIDSKGTCVEGKGARFIVAER